MRPLSESQSEKVDRALTHHERYTRDSYFWASPSNASGRRWVGKRDSFSVQFRYEGRDYKYESAVHCSCRNVYYKGHFFVDGQRKDVRAFTNLLTRERLDHADH